jgi:hypothetical protein
MTNTIKVATRRLKTLLGNSASGTNVHVSENKAVTIGDVTFHGATLWDFALMDDSGFCDPAGLPKGFL